MRISAACICIISFFLLSFSETGGTGGISESTGGKDTVVITPSAAAQKTVDTQKTSTSGISVVPTEKADVIVVGEEHAVSLSPAQMEGLKGVFKGGKILTTVGLILHAAGLAITLGSSGIQTDDARLSTDKTIISLIGSSAMITGPIISCAGATSVENGLNRAGSQAENPKVWAEYGWGWLFMGGSTALALGAVGVLVQSSSSRDGNTSTIAVPIIMLVGAVACEVLSEVEWMKCVIHARTYVSRMERQRLPGHTSISVTPVFTLDGRAGARLNVGF
jgi:hypothetical protein